MSLQHSSCLTFHVHVNALDWLMNVHSSARCIFISMADSTILHNPVCRWGVAGRKRHPCAATAVCGHRQPYGVHPAGLQRLCIALLRQAPHERSELVVISLYLL